MTQDWGRWHDAYDDPSSSLSRRLVEVRRQLGADLDARAAAGDGAIRLLSLCAGDGRDTIPELVARPGLEVDACLVELDPDLAEAARVAATAAGVSLDVRTADAGSHRTFADRGPSDVLMLCGIFGNVSDADIEGCVAAVPGMLRPGGTVVWTRGSNVPDDPSSRAETGGDPALWVRGLFADAGFEEVAFVRPDDASYRVGVCRRPSGRSAGWAPQWSFSFVHRS